MSDPPKIVRKSEDDVKKVVDEKKSKAARERRSTPETSRNVKKRSKFKCPATVEYFGRTHHTDHPSICTCLEARALREDPFVFG